MLITFMTSGYPDLETFKKVIKVMDENEADIIEIGIPFSDPLADGTIIQTSSQKALKNGITLKKTLYTIKELNKSTNVTFVIMSYYNPIVNYGIERFIEDATEAGISGVIIPDLPFDEKEQFYDRCREKELLTILMITPTTPINRAIDIAKKSQGFLYCVSLIGITGNQKKPLINWLSGPLQKIRKEISIPVVVGFGIDSQETARTVSRYADGIVVGSAIIKLLEEKRSMEEVANFIRELKNASEQ